MAQAFQVGKTYKTRSIVDADHVITLTVAGRTAKTIKTAEGKSLRVSEVDGVEQVRPWGAYSMAPVIRASRLAA